MDFVDTECLLRLINEYHSEQSISYEDSVKFVTALTSQYKTSNVRNNQSFKDLYTILQKYIVKDNHIEIKDFFVTMLLLCEGTVGEKILAIFKYFGRPSSDKDNYIIERSDLENVIYILLCLFLYGTQDSRIHVSNISQLSEYFTNIAMKKVVEASNNSNYVTYSLFIHCIRVFGNRYFPWMQYIDLSPTRKIMCQSPKRKAYQSHNERDVVSVESSYSSDESDDNSYAEDSDSSTPYEIVYDFLLSGNNQHLSISNGDIEFINDLVKETKLNQIECKDVYL